MCYKCYCWCFWTFFALIITAVVILLWLIFYFWGDNYGIEPFTLHNGLDWNNCLEMVEDGNPDNGEDIVLLRQCDPTNEHQHWVWIRRIE